MGKQIWLKWAVGGIILTLGMLWLSQIVSLGTSVQRISTVYQRVQIESPQEALLHMDASELLHKADSLAILMPDSALVYAEQAISKSSYTNDLALWADALCLHAGLLLREVNYSQRLQLAFTECRLAYDLYKQRDDFEGMVETKILMSACHSLLDEFTLSRQDLSTALNIISQIKEEPIATHLLSKIYFHLGLYYVTYWHNGDTTVSRDSVYKYFEKGFDLAEKSEDEELKWTIAHNKAMFLGEFDDFERAQPLSVQCIDYFREVRDTSNWADVLLNYGRLQLLRSRDINHQDSEILKNGINNIREALKLKPTISCEAYSNLSNIYHDLFAVQDSLNHLKAAKKHYYLAFEAALENADTRCFDTTLRNMAYLCEDTVNCRSLRAKADAVQREFRNILSQIVSESQFKIFSFDLMQLRQYYVAYIKQLTWIGFGGLLFLGIGFLLYVQQQKIHRLEDKVLLLQTQMTPHFISNTLNAIEYLVLSDQKEEAASAIGQFSLLCREILNSSRLPKIELRKEIDLLTSYLELQQLRLEEALEVEIEIDSSLNQEEVTIPPMLIQPFLENAIKHGIMPKKGTGKIRLRMKRLGQNSLYCEIEDNGIGRPGNYVNISNKESHSTKITKQRLQALYRSKGASLEIVDLKDELHQPKGTKVIICIPLKSQT